jgi:hypothetical protein
MQCWKSYQCTEHVPWWNIMWRHAIMSTSDSTMRQKRHLFIISTSHKTHLYSKEKRNHSKEQSARLQLQWRWGHNDFQSNSGRSSWEDTGHDTSQVQQDNTTWSYLPCQSLTLETAEAGLPLIQGRYWMSIIPVTLRICKKTHWNPDLVLLHFVKFHIKQYTFCSQLMPNIKTMNYFPVFDEFWFST